MITYKTLYIPLYIQYKHNSNTKTKVTEYISHIKLSLIDLSCVLSVCFSYLKRILHVSEL